MDAMTCWRSSRDAFRFDEHFDAPMGVDSAGGADSMVEDVEEGQFKAVVVENSGIPPPEAPVGVVEDVEDADEVDEGVGKGI